MHKTVGFQIYKMEINTILLHNSNASNVLISFEALVFSA